MIISSINSQIQQEFNTKFREYSGGCMKLLHQLTRRDCTKNKVSISLKTQNLNIHVTMFHESTA